MKQLLNSTFAAAVMLLFGAINEVNADPLTYLEERETATIVKCDRNVSGEIVIPSIYNGKPVTLIADDSFSDCVNLLSVTIPEGVTRISSDAFNNCNSLQNIKVVEANSDYSSLDGVLFDKRKNHLVDAEKGGFS